MWFQIFATVIVNLQTLAFGISVGWAAPNTLLFQTESSPIGIMDADQISLIASILCIGGVVGTILFGCIVDVWGRKYTMIAMAVPQIIANILLLVGTHYYHIYAARFLFGLAAGGVYILVPIFVSEISFERIRGALGNMMCFMNNSGIVLGFILSSWMDYYKMPYIATALSIIFLTIFVWLPESPDYLMHINRLEEAKRSYAFYGNNRTPGPAETNIESGQTETQKKQLELVATDTADTVDARQRKISWNDFADKAVQRGIFLSISLILFADTSGVFAIVHFMTELFETAQMDLDIYVATVAVGLIQMVGSVVSILSVDRFGRRALLMISAGGTGVCLFAFGAYFYLLARPEHSGLVKQLQWLPLVSVCGVIFIASCAVSSLPFFIISELMPLKVRGFVTTLCLIISWIFAFLILQYYHAMVELLGIDRTMWTYGSCCFVEIAFVYFFLPETKNLTFEEIQNTLRKC